ncbi:hypothetical protein [Chitinophaga sp.]
MPFHHSFVLGFGGVLLSSHFKEASRLDSKALSIVFC